VEFFEASATSTQGTCAHIKEVKTMTAKSSAKQKGEGESSPPA